MPKTGGLVEWTLAQEPQVIDGEEIPAHYEVLDMSKDPRWSANHFVSSEPWFKYYCGLPLRTENGINIGALFLLDDEPRDSTSLARLKVLTTIAANIMVHMKTVKEAHEKQRAIHMNMCMADFISPAHRFRSRQMKSHGSDSPDAFDNTRTSRFRHRDDPVGSKSRSSPGPTLSPQPPHDRPSNPPARDLSISPTPPPRTDSWISNEQHELYERNYMTSVGDATQSRPHEDTPASTPGTEDNSSLDAESISGVEYTIGTRASTQQSDTHTESQGRSGRGRPQQREDAHTSTGSSKRSKHVTEADHQRAFDRAAYLLRQSLDLSQFGGGGVVLLDTNAGAASTDPISKRHESDYDDINAMSERPTAEPRQNSRNQFNTDRGGSAYSGNMQERVVLAAASISENAGCPKNFGRADPTWRVTLSPPELQRMCKRHPRGKLYDIPESVGTTLFDYEGRTIAGRLSAKLYELVLIRRQFPAAKQVIFVPMFHANLNRWTSCFAFTNSRYRVFSYDMDYLPMLSFTNAIKAEIVRLATVFADQQKSDFIGSVSHELRSPLHGILASLEFLQDTDLDDFQSTCVNTMDACAHTLLDTVAMVLDYNKVNTIKRKTSSSSQRTHSSDEPPDMMPSQGGIKNEPLFATNQDCDVALITEEVIDGLATGHLAKVRTNFSFDDVIRGVNATLSDVSGNLDMRRILRAVRPEVELIFNVQPPTDWSFSTHPGAIRRIVMNLFGNSLKYTKHGYIMVSLRRADAVQEEASIVRFTENNTTSTIKLIVADTGQGISPEYLRTKVFTPFAQENAKAAGTGLGLSIVRSIVGSLQGEIDIKSIVNVGTIVMVTLRSAMKKAIPISVNPSITSTGLASSSGSEITLVTPQQRRRDLSVSTLQNLQNPPQAAIYEPAMEHDSFGQTQGAVHVHAALVRYLTGWFGFPTLQTWDFDFPSRLLIVDEIHLPTLLARRPDYFEKLSLQSIIILCANPARQAVLSQDIKSNHVELVSKPFGPYKLARAICRGLEKAAITPTAAELKQKHGRGGANTPGSAISSSSMSSEQKRRRKARASSQGDSLEPELPPTHVTPANGGETHFKETTISSEGHIHEVKAGSDGGFPFPAYDTYRERLTPPLKLPRDDPNTGMELPLHLAPLAADKSDPLQGRPAVNRAQSDRVETSTTRDKINLWDKQPGSQSRKPHLLLVDDNRLNLQLLHTYISRRGYDGALARTAEDGQQALDIYQEFMPDIVFMDLSMPVMDGFESTREIRAFEAARRREAKRNTPTNENGLGTFKPAVIIALTGNAKGSDQTEAFNAGIDMYMTKPVSFKQIGILLENWRDT